MTRPKILLVDDNRLFLEMERNFLQPCAVQVYTARTGREALDLVRVVLPDLIFMDLHMPEMDGDICCAMIKADPDLKNVPVVMIVAEVENMERCRLAGCDMVLPKPIDRTDFLAAGHRFLPELDRIEVRIACVTLVVFTVGDTAAYGTGVNLSTSGMFIAFDGEVELEDPVRLSFMLPNLGGAVIEAEGRVAWRNCGNPLTKSSLPRGLGVEFNVITGDAVAIIAQYMAGSGSGDQVMVEEAYLADSSF